MKKQVRALALALTLMLVSRASWGAESTWNLESLMASLSSVKSASAVFKEEKRSALLKKPLVLTGRVDYYAPAKVVKEIISPYGETMSIDGDRLVTENSADKSRKSISLKSQPLVWAFVESFRSTLAGDSASLNRFYNLELSGGERGWKLNLRPRYANMRDIVEAIVISGERGVITRIEIRESGGDVSIMTMSVAQK